MGLLLVQHAKSLPKDKDPETQERKFHESMKGSMYYWPSYNAG